MSDEKQSKSVLDGIPVDEIKEAFDVALQRGGVKVGAIQAETLCIIGACPQCGAAVYGETRIKRGDKPQSVYSCNCFRKDGIVKQSYEPLGENKEHK